jgi:hypothetical protein
MTLLLAPAALLTIRGRNDERSVMGLSGVAVDCGCGLGAEVSDFGVEVEGAYTVGTLRTVELHAALDALDSIGLH